ncbi:MAG: SusC/RagA family TonB-linked outer membrane protein [Chitinophagales bacterium]|nr:MAG: SusC/RagA family TonB-linked outer membrane protein [Chitinophagales bacterium]
MKRMLLFSMIFILCLSNMLMAQKTVTGTVKSKEEKEPIFGATVLVKGTEIATSTDFSGAFSIQVPAGYSVLEVRSLGMAVKEVDISASDNVVVELEPDLLKINQIVITALGIPREEKSLGYSSQQIAGDRVAESGEINVIQGLAAKSAGVQVISSAGVPGASSKILIRGNHTFTGENQPLIIVDGVPIDNSTSSTVAGDYPFSPNLTGVNNSNRAIDLNPEDIESYQILKGPAAAALYGVRAANGAIVITTKRGKTTDQRGYKVTYSYNVGFSQVNKLPEFQHTYGQGIGGGGLSTDADGNPIDEGIFDEADPGADLVWGTPDDGSIGTSRTWGPKITNIPVLLPGGDTVRDNSGNIVYRKPVDNVERFFQTGVVHDHNLSVSGGGENATFRLSFNRTYETGIVPNTSYARNSFRVTTDAVISPKFDMGATANYINSGGTKAQNGSNLSGVALGLFRTPDSFDLLGGGGTSEGLLGEGKEKGYTKENNITQHQYFMAYDNSYWTVYENPFTDNINRIIGSGYITYKPAKWLHITGKGGLDYYTDQRKQIYSYSSNEPPEPVGQIEENTITVKDVYADLLASLQHEFGKDFDGSLTFGVNVTDQQSKDVYSRGRNFSIPFGYYNLSNTINLYTDENHAHVRSSAFFIDLNVGFRNMLYLQVTSRTEWSSTFGSNKNNFTFPSANIAFVFSELLPQNNILPFGKLRYGFAQAGLSPPAYSSVTTYTTPIFTDGFTDGLTFPYLDQNGIGHSSLNILGNPDLKPERTNGHEVGLDLRFWKGRIHVDYTFYHQKTKDIILQQPISTSSGFRYVFNNAGEMVNKGHELVLDADVVRKKGFIWNVNMNFTRNKNEVTKLAEGVDQIDLEPTFSSIGSYAIVGQPYGTFYGTTWYRDANGNLIIDPTTGLPIENAVSTAVGNPYPDYQIGLGTTLSYKGVSLRMLFDIMQGNEGWAGTVARLHLLGRSAASEDRGRFYVIEGVLQEVDGGGNPVYDADGNPVASSTPNNIEISAFEYFTFFKGDAGALEEQIADASWVRMRELGLSYHYELPQKIKFFRAFDISFTARNVFLITDYPGVDPETSLLGAGSNVNGYDYFNMPNTRSYHLGVKLYLN